MSLEIRPFTEEDISAAGVIARTMQPPYLADWGLTLWQDVYRVAADRFCLAGAWGDDGVIGCGALWRVGGGKFRLDVMVHPRGQRQGAGGALLARLLEEARRQGASRVQARARDDRPAALSFLQNRGFVESHRMDRFWLDPATADPRALQAWIAAVEKRGVILTTLAAEQALDPECWRKLYELYLAVIPDWPDPDPDPVPGEPPSFTDFLRQVDSPAGAPETMLLAKTEDRLVGFCGGLGTAVHREYRGCGIATAMEARVIEWSRDVGSQSLVAGTANPAMRAVYAKLGYQRTFSEVRLLRRLEGPAGAKGRA